MKQWLVGLFFITTSLWGAEEAVNLTPEQAFQKLMKGNERFVNSDLLHPRREDERRIKTAIAQKPFAVILGCSDSRVPPEILFDQGIGDLFIVRVAGNVSGPVERASIDYAVLMLGASFVLVLGHEHCGAVTAVLEGKTKGIEPVAQLIAPAVEEAKTQSGDRLENAIRDNVRHVVEELRDAEEFKDLIKRKKLAIMGGVYDLEIGKVRILKE